MPLFSTKGVCPVCGRKIRGDVRIKIKDNVEICSTCGAQIEMDASLLPTMTVEDIRTHLAYREENRAKMEQFTKTKSAEVGAYRLRVDENMGLWYCSNDRRDSNPPLFAFEELRSAVYTENGERVEDIQTGLKALLERQAPELINSMKIRIEVDNPYFHEIVVEALGPGEGVTSGTMQYKMKRHTIHGMLDILAQIRLGADSTEPTSTAPQEAPEHTAMDVDEGDTHTQE